MGPSNGHVAALKHPAVLLPSVYVSDIGTNSCDHLDLPRHLSGLAGEVKLRRWEGSRSRLLRAHFVRICPKQQRNVVRISDRICHA